MMDPNELFLKKIFESYKENEDVFIANRKRGKKYLLTFIDIFEENRDILIFQRYRTTYILLSSLIDGTEPDEYNRVGKDSSSFYDEDLLKKKKDILTSLMIEENKEKIQSLMNEYNQMKRDKSSLFKNEKSEKKMREIILTLKNEIKK